MNAPSPLILPEELQRTPDPTPVPSSIIEEGRTPSAIEKRADNGLFPLTWSLSALSSHLPLPFPSDPTAPPSPKARYRSHYCYQGFERLLDDSKRKNMSDFEIAACLIDFSALERELASCYRPSRKGQTPFHPVSMFLAVCLRIETGQSWRKVSTLLAGENGAGWRRLFGFEEGCTPSASGLRYFFQRSNPKLFAELCPRWAKLLAGAGLFPEHSTYPGDPPEQGVAVTQDGMLHEARSRPSCQLATDECYREVAGSIDEARPLPLEEALPGAESSPEQTPAANDPPKVDTSSPAAESSPTPGRRCRARQQGREGCDCNTPECRQQCRRASTLDPEARFIHYQGHNGKLQGTGGKEGGGCKGKDVFGYRSIAERVLDDRWAVGWIVSSGLYSANTDERTVFLSRLQHLRSCLPEMKIGEWLDDSGVGYGECLNAIWQLGALRMVDIREDPGDKEFEVCLRRGYDGKGRPLCAHGYPMRPNGYDYERRRAKYVCAQVCTREPLHEKKPVEPPPGCPYLDEAHPLGQVRNVGRVFPDGSVRLAREIPYGSDAWKARYGRRNLSESRNAQMEGLGLKRMRSYGLPRSEKEVRLADFILNLHTLGRLVREATGLDSN